MTPPRFLVGKLPDGSERWAAIDPSARFLKASIGERRFQAYMAPFTSEEAAREALTVAGADNIAAEERKRGHRGR